MAALELNVSFDSSRTAPWVLLVHPADAILAGWKGPAFNC
jgi:hypothetical protein